MMSTNHTVGFILISTIFWLDFFFLQSRIKFEGNRVTIIEIFARKTFMIEELDFQPRQSGFMIVSKNPDFWFKYNRFFPLLFHFIYPIYLLLSNLFDNTYVEY